MYNYPNEPEDAYMNLGNRNTNDCEIESMRALDIVGTSNPKKPQESNGQHYVLWEARHSNALLSAFLCPPAKNGADGLSETRRLDVLSFGGEVEVKQMKILLASERAAPVATVYNKKLLEFTWNGAYWAQFVGESNDGTDPFVELVTHYWKPTAEIKTQFTCIQTATMALGNPEGRKISIRELPGLYNGQFTGGCRSMRATLNGVEPDLHDLKLTGFPTFNTPQVACQGNYMISIEKGLEHEGDGTKRFKPEKGGTEYWKAVEQAEFMVGVMLTDHAPAAPALNDSERKYLTALLAIHIQNSYWSYCVNTGSGTLKDKWGHLPKTPVLDLVRAAPQRVKDVLLSWVKAEAGTCAASA